MMVLKSFLCVVMLITMQGCTILNHLDELSMMGDYSRDKDNQHKLVKASDANFEDLLKAVESKQLENYTDQVDIRSRFGEPILIKNIQTQGQQQQQWLYRKALIKDAKDKVYLYFDDTGKLIRYEQEKILW